MIVGAGVNGLGIAYRLALEGVEDVVVLEKRYLGYGASGRNGGAIRQQWGVKEKIILARESLKIWEGLSEELNYHTLLRRGGSLMLALTEEDTMEFKENVRLQKSLGVETKHLEPEEAGEILPLLSTDKVLGATFCPSDAVALPFSVLWGYERAARKRGVELNTFTEVTDIRVSEGEVKSVLTNRGEIKTPVVVNAAGAYSKEVAKMAGVDLPNKPSRREALVLEPLKPFLNPMILVPHNGLWMNQTLRGEVIGGVDTSGEVSYSLRASIGFLEKFARAATDIIPQFKHLKVLRQWAGLQDTTPDERPILGEVDEVRGFIQANGFGDYGLTISPVVAKLIAELIVDGKTSYPLDALNFRRFRKEE